MQSYSFITAEDLINTAKAEAIGSTTSSLTALQNTQLLAKASQLNAEFVNAAHTRHPLGGWSWMRKVSSFSSVAATTLNGATSAGAATFILTSATNWDSTGRSIIERTTGAFDIVDHESKATHTLTVSTATGAETLSSAHSDLERVEKMYALPSDYSKARVLYVGNNEYEYETFEGFPLSGCYTTYGAYILLPRGIGAQSCTLIYLARGNSITALTDSTNIPSEFSRYAIEKMKAHIYAIRRKREDIQFALNLAEECLQYALSQDSQQIANSERTRIPLPY